MAKKFTYTNSKNGRIVFETVVPNYKERNDVDREMAKKTGIDPRLNPHRIDCQIRVVADRELA